MKYLVYSIIIGTGSLFLTSCPGGSGTPAPAAKPAPEPVKATSLKPEAKPTTPPVNPTKPTTPPPTGDQGKTPPAGDQGTNPGQGSADNQGNPPPGPTPPPGTAQDPLTGQGGPQTPPGNSTFDPNTQSSPDQKPRPIPNSDYIEIVTLGDPHPGINHKIFADFQKYDDEGLYWAIKDAMKKDQSLRYPLAVVLWKLKASIMAPITLNYHYYVAPLIQVENDRSHPKGDVKVGDFYERKADKEVYEVVRILQNEPKPNTAPVTFDCGTKNPFEMDGIKGRANCAAGRFAKAKKDWTKCFMASVMAVETLPNFKKEPVQLAIDGYTSGTMYISFDDVDAQGATQRMYCVFHSAPFAGGHH